MANVLAPGLVSTPRQSALDGISVHKGLLKPTAQVAIADVLYLVRVPAWHRPRALTLIVDTANAGVTIKAGWRAVDADANFINDAGLIVAGTAMATVGRFTTNAGVLPPLIPKDWDLIVTVAGAVISTATSIYAFLDTLYEGNQ